MNSKPTRPGRSWGKKEKHCDRTDPADNDYGDCWDFVLFDARSRFVVSLAMGCRTAEMAQCVFADFYRRTDGSVPSLITTDEYPAYESVIVSTYDVSSPPDTEVVLPEELCYATVCKRREKGRVVEIDLRTVLGTDEQVACALENSPCSQTINTSHVERFNGTQRHFNARKARKVCTFSKEITYHIAVTWLCITAYNFCWAPRTLRQKLRGSPRRYRYRTPAMAIGLTDEAWSLRKLLTYPILPDYDPHAQDSRKREAG